MRKEISPPLVIPNLIFHLQSLYSLSLILAVSKHSEMRLNSKSLEAIGHNWINFNFCYDMFFLTELDIKISRVLLKREVRFNKKGKDANRIFKPWGNSKCEEWCNLVLWSFLSVQALSRYVELHSHSSSYNCLYSVGSAVVDQKQGKNLWHGISSRNSHIISAR